MDRTQPASPVPAPDKPSLFIGSSSEGLAVARAIKEQFDAEADVDLWNEGVFQLNTSYLESLLRATSLYDFALLVLTPDDLVTSRGKRRAAPRDNVLFEHGLFLGRLGPRRAFVVCDESIKLFSDFAGITVATYRRRDDEKWTSAVGTACNRIRAAMREQAGRSEISLLPSTALAIGYHENFISKVVAALQEKKDLRLKLTRTGAEAKKCAQCGQALTEATPLSYDAFVLRVIIPTDLSAIGPKGLPTSLQSLVQIRVSTPYRDFPFYIRARDQAPEPKRCLELFDLPTTLLASRQAIELILKDAFVGKNRDQEKLERREIRNFEKTLRFLIERDYGPNPPYLKLEPFSCLDSV